jgi:glycosyltransferase involved in cell wall biosynthesis
MRIAYLHQYFNTPEMSGGTRSYEMARRLVAAGHEVDLVTARRDGGDAAVEIVDGIRVHWLPVAYDNAMGYGRRLAAFAAFALAAARRAATLDVDVVFATSTPLTIAIPGVWAARRRRVPFVFEVRDLWPGLPIAVGALRNPVAIALARRLERWAYRRADALVALSPGMRDGIVEAGGAAARVTVIPNSADLAHFHPDPVAGRRFRAEQGLPEAALLVTYAGTLGRINGVDWLVHLARELRDARDIHFLLVGDGHDVDAVRAAAADDGTLGVTVHLAGRLPKREMAAVLAATDVAVSVFRPLPEMEANSANKVFDALAAGCCVAINYGGWQEALLADSGAGLRLPREPAAAAAVLRELASDRDRVEAAGRAARALAEAHFDRDDHARALEGVLRGVVDEARDR